MHDYIRSSASIKSTTNVMDLKELLWFSLGLY
jgi:hypothetical protein